MGYALDPATERCIGTAVRILGLRARGRICARILHRTLLAGLVGASTSGPVLAADAQSFPSAPMRIISPYPPGGGTDILARALGQRMSERYKQPVTIENRAGANGTIGTAAAAKAAPDGHTMVVVAAAFAAGNSLYRNLPYDPARDLAPVSRLAAGPLVLVVHPSLPVKTTRDLVALARKRPGEVNVGSSGIGSLPHLTAELFGSMSGVKLTHVPYKGPSAALIDVLSGQVPTYFMNILGALPLVQANKLRAIAVSSPERTPIAPDIPTVAESGLAGFDMTNWYGLLVPAGTPREIVGQLHQEVARIMGTPELRKLMAAGGMTVVASTPEQFIEFLARESVKYAEVIRLAGVKPE